MIPNPQQPPPTAGPPSYGPPSYGPPRTSGTGTAALIFGILALLLAIVPFAGFIGLVAVVLALVDRDNVDEIGRPVSRGASNAGLVMGLLGCLAATGWVIFAAVFSCPHVYVHDGTAWRLDADPLSGSLFRAGESTDWDRLEHLKAHNGVFRVKVQNDLEEVDHLDALQLRVVDHPQGTEALPTQDGRLMVLEALRPPLSGVNRAGRDVRRLLSQADRRSYQSDAQDFPATTDEEPRDWIDLTFHRPPGQRAVLVLRGHTTRFAADAFSRYLSRMGPGLGLLLHLAETGESYPYRKRLADETDRLGLNLEVELWDGRAFRPAALVRPIGPAVLRSQAVALTLPTGSEAQALRVRLRMAPLFWSLDQVELAPAPSGSVESNAALLKPTGVPGSTQSGNAASILASVDGERLTLEQGQGVELRFAAPPPPPSDQTRTVLVQITGYYEFEVGGRALINPIRVLRHRSGEDSLPRYALELARASDAPSGP